MKTKTFLFLPALAMVLFSCSTPQVTVNKDQALADSLLIKVDVVAWNSGDAQTIADLFTDDCLLLDNFEHPQGIWTKDSLLVFLKVNAPFIKNFQAVLGPTTVSGDHVYMQKYWTFNHVEPDKHLLVRGISTIIWVKQPDNSWKIALEQNAYSFKTY